MTGHWSVLHNGRRWPRSARRAWLMMRRGDAEVVEFDGPVLELMTDARTRTDPRLAHLGPDILAPEFDAERFLRRLREDDPTRPIADALLDQQTIAGIGNLWKSEGCFAAAIDPWRPTGRVSDAEALAIVEAIRPRMQRSAGDGFQARDMGVFERAGRPCPRCGPASRIVKRYQGDGNRKTFWCQACQS
jgi:endonuclease-8